MILSGHSDRVNLQMI